jgi:hypothetical protein
MILKWGAVLKQTKWLAVLKQGMLLEGGLLQQQIVSF